MGWRVVMYLACVVFGFTSFRPFPMLVLMLVRSFVLRRG